MRKRLDSEVLRETDQVINEAFLITKRSKVERFPFETSLSVFNNAGGGIAFTAAFLGGSRRKIEDAGPERKF